MSANIVNIMIMCRLMRQPAFEVRLDVSRS